MGLSVWLPGAPFLAALLTLVLPSRRPTEIRLVTGLGCLVSLVLAIVAWLSYGSSQGGFQHVASLAWFTLPNVWLGHNLTIGLSFGVDGLSLPLLTLTAVIALLAVIGVPRPAEQEKAYRFWQGLLVAAILGVLTALDLFTFLVAVELALFSGFFLILQFGGPDRRHAAYKFLIYRGFASVGLLVVFIGLAYGLAGLYYSGGTAGSTPKLPGSVGTLTFSIATLQHDVAHAASVYGGIRPALFLVLLLAVFIEEAFVPFHTWLPKAHEQADTATNMLIGGMLTKTGAYVLLRFGVGMLPDEVHRFSLLLAVFGVINILYGAFAAWAARGWRRLTAFSSISHMGLVLLGISAMNSAGLQGAMFMMVSSGLLTAFLFYLAGAIEERTGSSQMDRLGGLSKSMPTLSGFLLFAALGSLGLPLTSGFISEIQAFIGAFGGHPYLSFVGLLGLILSATYLLYAIQKTTFGPRVPVAAAVDARAVEYLPLIVLTALVLVVGVYPEIIGNLFGLSAGTLLGIGG
ncbi:MAG: NADH-quinone oxidoreductase subunit M [Alicyclobacillus herbarius]|uniref:complex I subunit 4 family protein n=1 Tax=Alicyclobacillus herbarius TaxID=122960 RepID=UPI0023578E76|nr:NADH-quinone oxidoreductase subunit M [Alicyclobacillus herbarius]MCL6632610.1 NADH-quinone oxidoreductase subunit M [Alicyclobacillus herbarius]